MLETPQISARPMADSLEALEDWAGRFSAPSSQALVLPSRVRSPAIYGAANRSA